MSIEIVVNGESKIVPPGTTVSALLRTLGVDPERVAVELDRAIIRRAQWDDTRLDPGSKLEIVQFVGGG